MGNCNTCQCDGNAEDKEFNIEVSYKFSIHCVLYVGLVKTNEEVEGYG